MQALGFDGLRELRARWGVVWLCSLVAVGCAPSTGNERVVPDELDGGAAADARVADVNRTEAPDLSPADKGLLRPGFCARAGADAVRDLFCDASVPSITSLVELQQRLALDPYRASSSSMAYSMGDAGAPTRSYPPADASVVLNLNVALLGHSTALAGSLVSPINPRAIVLGQSTLMAFHRGVQRVELITQARDQSRLNLYLLSFVQACNAAAEKCSSGDLYTARIESDWQSVQVQDDEELKNTNSDCRQCHQRSSDTPILLMRELNGPWTHFFAHDRDDVPAFDYPEPSGRDLVRDYRHAKGEESYAGMPIAILRGTIGLSLESRVFFKQPLLFEGTTILNERWPEGPDGFLPRPNRSPTWDRAYEAFKRGEQLALPYFLTRPTDPDKQAALSAAYQRYRAGLLSADELPDLSDIYPDDPRTRAEIGLQTEPGASAAEALVQACGSCHNDVLDQTISRARFSIDLSRMDQAERELAILRIQRPIDSVGAMPPPETRQLDAEAREKLVAFLRNATRPAEDDALLTRAAALGMAVVVERPSSLPLY